MLDQARADKLPLVTALERLLAVEVDATENRRLTSRLRFACLPAPWTLTDFDYASASAWLSRCSATLASSCWTSR